MTQNSTKIFCHNLPRNNNAAYTQCAPCDTSLKQSKVASGKEALGREAPHTNIKPVYTTCLGSKRRPQNPQVAIFSLLIDWARSRGRKDPTSSRNESKGFLLNKLWATLCGNEKGSSRIYFCMRRIVKKFGSTQLGVGGRGTGVVVQIKVKGSRKASKTIA